MSILKRLPFMLAMTFVPTVVLIASQGLTVEVVQQAIVAHAIPSPPSTAPSGFELLSAACQRSPGIRVWQGCTRYELIDLVRHTAVTLGSIGFALLLCVDVATWATKSSRVLLAFYFSPLLFFIVGGVLLIIPGNALIAGLTFYMVATMYVDPMFAIMATAVLVGPLIAASRGLTAILETIWIFVRPPRLRAEGLRITREGSPRLWAEIAACAARVGTAPPRNVVAVLEPEFFVTETSVRCLDGTLRGRSLVVSLSLCHILSVDELRAMIAHELAHFKGADTLFSRYFYPVFRRRAEAASRLRPQLTNLGSLVVLFPATVLFEAFFDAVLAVERPIGRNRELAADLCGARATSLDTAASALAKTAAFSAVWSYVDVMVRRGELSRRPVENAAAVFEQAVLEPKKISPFDKLGERQLAHPFDTHPPVAVRLGALGISLEQAIADAQQISTINRAIDLLTTPDEIEMRLTSQYCERYR